MSRTLEECAPPERAAPRCAIGDELRSRGWTMLDETGFASLLGSFWRLGTGPDALYGLATGPQHANRNGTVHGGVLLAIADHAMGYTSSASGAGEKQATIQLGLHFSRAAMPGDFVTARSRVVRRTQSLAFVASDLFARDELIANASGIWKVARRARHRTPEPRP